MVRTLLDDPGDIPGRAVISDPKVIEALGLHLSKEAVQELDRMQRGRTMVPFNIRHVLVD